MANQRSRSNSGRPGRGRAGSSWLAVGGLFGVAAVAALFGAVSFLPSDQDQGPLFQHTVRNGEFVHEISERGEVQSSHSVEVRCKVKSRGGQGTPILELIEEGAYVKKGDVLAVLDASAFEEELQQQQIICNTSEALVIQASNLYETAEIAKREYMEGTFKQEAQLIEGEIFVAEENVRRAKEYVEYSRKLAASGYVTDLQLEADEFAVEKAKKELETARTKLRVLQNFTKAKTIKQLASDINTYAAQLMATEKSNTLELAKRAATEKQIANCTILAPSDGEVVFYSNQDRFRSPEQELAEGTPVRERQILFQLPDPSQMEVVTKINESRIGVVQVGMPATIRLDAQWDKVLHGKVTKIDRKAIRGRWSASNVKEYLTYVEIENPPKNLRSGFTANVKILIERLSDQLLVPVQAVVQHGPKHYCLTLDKDNARTLREVEIGMTNDKHVVISKGLSEGDVVLQNPRKYLDEIDLPTLDPKRGGGPGKNGRRSPKRSPRGRETT